MQQHLAPVESDRRTAVGRILARNSCRNPWVGTLSARATKVFPTPGRRALQVSADLYNVLNLINGQWGLSQFDVGTFAAPLLVLSGYDVGNGRGVYQVPEPPGRKTEDLASRWQLELSVRYLF